MKVSLRKPFRLIQHTKTNWLFYLKKTTVSGSKVIVATNTNDRIMIRHNFSPERDIEARSTRVIMGNWFQQPNIAIGGVQEGNSVTIGGTAESDKFIWKQENPSQQKFRWERE